MCVSVHVCVCAHPGCLCICVWACPGILWKIQIPGPFYGSDSEIWAGESVFWGRWSAEPRGDPGDLSVSEKQGFIINQTRVEESESCPGTKLLFQSSLMEHRDGSAWESWGGGVGGGTHVCWALARSQLLGLALAYLTSRTLTAALWGRYYYFSPISRWGKFFISGCLTAHFKP